MKIKDFYVDERFFKVDAVRSIMMSLEDLEPSYNINVINYFNYLETGCKDKTLAQAYRAEKIFLSSVFENISTDGEMFVVNAEYLTIEEVEMRLRQAASQFYKMYGEVELEKELITKLFSFQELIDAIEKIFEKTKQTVYTSHEVIDILYTPECLIDEMMIGELKKFIPNFVIQKREVKISKGNDILESVPYNKFYKDILVKASRLYK